MQLETLELVFDYNIERIQEAANRLKPMIDKMMSQVEDRTQSGSDRAEKNLNFSKGFEEMTKHFEKMNANLDKQFSRMNDNFKKQTEQMQQTSERSSSRVGQNFSKGFQKARRESGKEVDAIVKDIDSKMKQARAQQEKLAFLRSQRQSSRDSGDPESAVRYEEQVARAEAAMSRFHGSARQMAQGLQNEFKVIPREMDGITEAMAQSSAQIESMRSRINQLKEDYQSQLTPKGNFTDGFTYVDSKSSLQTQGEIEKQTQRMNQAIQKNDELSQAYSRLEDRLREVTPAVKNLNTELGDTRSYDSATQSAGRFDGAFKNIKRRTSDFFNRFRRGSRQVQTSTRQMSNPLGGMNKMIGQFTRRLLILGVAYRAFSGAATYMGKAVMANEEFAQSLNAIKVNLATAFYPIYQAVMPALNTFIQWIATATAYLAQFIATLFGTTYSAAKKGASALNQQIADMDDTGAAADRNAQRVKRFQRSLMGFDEINTLDMSDDDPDISGNNKTPDLPNGIDFNIPDPKIPAWVGTFADKVKNILSRLFAPMKAAWDTHGQTVMDAWNYALDETWQLVQLIGRDFMRVWENGTGERTIGNILLLVAELGFWIGDIARAFKIAWEEAGRGEALIQSIFDKWNEIFELILAISGSFREVWNDGTGIRIAGNLLEIFTGIHTTIGNLARGFREAWQEADTGTDIARTTLGFVEDILSTINDMTQATSEWADNLNLSPILQSLSGLFESIRPSVQFILDLLSSLYTDILLPIGKWVIEDALPASIDVLSESFNVLNAIFESLRPLGKWLLDNFLTPLGNWAGDAVVWILEKLSDALNGIGNFISNHQTGFSNFVLAFVTFGATLKIISLASAAITVLSGIFTFLSSIGGLSGIISLVVGKIGGLVAILGGPITIAIGVAIAAGVLLWKNWDTVKEKASQLGSWIGEKWEGLKTATGNAWGWIKDRISGNSKDASDNAIANYEDMEVKSSSIFGGISGLAKRFFPETTKTITNRVEEARKNVSDRWNSMWTNSRDRFNEIKNNASTRFNETKNEISGKASEAWLNTRTYFGNLKDNALSRFREVSNSARDRFNEVRENISNRAGTARDQASSAFRTMRDNISGAMSTIRSTTSNAFDTVAGWASGLGGRIASGLRGGIDAIRNVTRSIGNTLVNIPGRAVNGVLGGVRWVLNRVGAKNMANNLSNYTIPTYMHGTGYHPGGMAMVNDAPGSYYREAYQLPDGKVGLFPNERNLMVDLPRGAKVLNGEETHSLVHMDPDIPQYKNGIGNFFSNVWNGAKNLVGSVWDYVSNPSKLLEVAISKFVNLSGAIQPQLDMAKGAISTASEGAVSLIRNQLEKGQAAGTASGGGVNFKGLRQTSPFGYRIHPIYGTRRLHAGVDFAGGQGIGHPIHAQAGGTVTHGGPSGGAWGTFVRIKQGIMDYIYAHLNRALVSSGQRVNRGQLIGQMGNTGASTGPHVHYEVRRGGRAINPMNTISGYANGGMVRRDQIIRIAEQNKPEMVLPLTKPSRALDLIDQALDFMGIDLNALSMPEIFDTPFEDISVGRNFDSTSQDQFNAPAPISNSITEAIQLLLGQVGTGNATQDAEIVLQVGEAQLGRVVIKAINKLTQKTGQTLLIV